MSKQVFGWWWMDILIVATNIVSLSGFHVSVILLVFTPANHLAVVYSCVISIVCLCMPFTFGRAMTTVLVYMIS
jgi:hypothetical protein